MILAIVFLLALLVLPLSAILHLPAHFDLRIVFGYAALISLVAYLAHGSDKAKAAAGEWRIPESTLHFLELLGGWPGAFLAQRQFRHKIRKASYQFIFWGIVLIHEFVSYRFIHGWQ